MTETWLTGPPNDDVDSEHLYNRMFYGLEDARYMILSGWAEDVLKKYNCPRRNRPYQTGQAWGISWIEGYSQINKVAWKLERVIKSRKWPYSLLQRLIHYYSE